MVHSALVSYAAVDLHPRVRVPPSRNAWSRWRSPSIAVVPRGGRSGRGHHLRPRDTLFAHPVTGVACGCVVLHKGIPLPLLRPPDVVHLAVHVILRVLLVISKSNTLCVASSLMAWHFGGAEKNNCRNSNIHKSHR